MHRPGDVDYNRNVEISNNDDTLLEVSPFGPGGDFWGHLNFDRVK